MPVVTVLRSARGRVLAAGLLACALLLSGCRTIRERAQDGLRAALPQVIGPADSYQVTIDGPSGGLRHGRAARVRVVGTRVRAKGLPEFDEMQLEARDLVIDMRTRSVQSCRAATFAATLSDAELTRLLNARVPMWKRKRVRALDRCVRIEGWLNVGPLTLRGAGDYALSIRRGVEIWATPTRVSFERLQARVPDLVRTHAAAAVNPIYTLRDEQLKLRLTRIVPTPGRVWLYGTFNPVGMKLEEAK